MANNIHTRTITRKNGHTVTVLLDECDLPLYDSHKWFVEEKGDFRKTYRVLRRHNKRGLYLHRVLTNAPPGMLVDHINCNPLDNRRSNLRLATMVQNSQNKSKNSRPGISSKFKGVCFYRPTGKWVVHVRRDYLGYFTCEIEAAKAYNRAAIAAFGEFANLNEV